MQPGIGTQMPWALSDSCLVVTRSASCSCGGNATNHRVSAAAARVLSSAACSAAAPWTQAEKAAALERARHLRIACLAALAIARCRAANVRHRCTAAQYSWLMPGTLLADTLLGT